ncbi:MAG TPA: CocE/NonD family hydrolase [Mycobacterium sp.]|nr:CocE/NonD family hydrolase [Mycobacterium sp.]
MLKLPPGGGYTVARAGVPMRDGVVLLADHYAPVSAARGTLLVRGPYGRGFPFSLLFARIYAARGYHVVVQSVRGTFGSGGVFEPTVNEAADGADTVVWLRRQPWFTGSFGTIGLSYLGFTQWALLVDPPPELAAAVIAVGPHDFSESAWSTGSFTLNDFLGWSDLMAHQEVGGRVRAGIRQLTARHRLRRATAGLPLGAAGRALLDSGAPWYESWVEHPDLDDPFWGRYQLGAALDRVAVPVLLLGGWQDLFLGQTLLQYRRLRDRGVDVALTIGPWAHVQVLTNGLGTVTRESLDWLETHLAGAASCRPSRVRVFRTGSKDRDWCELPDWPPPTSPRTWYLQPGGELAPTPPTAAATSVPASFRYDPADPTPTVGGRMLSPDAGYRDDGRLARRDDVLSFTGEVLAQDVYVSGNPVVELAHTADNPHVDLFVRVSEVDAGGRSRNVSDGYRRLGDSAGAVRVELDAIAHRFTTGSRIRLLIAGGCHPRYARNLGAGEPPVSGARLQPATHTVHFGGSRLVLPVAEPVATARAPRRRP